MGIIIGYCLKREFKTPPLYREFFKSLPSLSFLSDRATDFTLKWLVTDETVKTWATISWKMTETGMAISWMMVKQHWLGHVHRFFHNFSKIAVSGHLLLLQLVSGGDGTLLSIVFTSMSSPNQAALPSMMSQFD